MSTHDIAPETPVDVDEKHLNDEVNTETKAGQLSANQQTLVDAAVRQKSKNLGTFTAIRHYWIAFLWAQFAAFGTILTGYDGTVAGAVLSVPTFRSTLGEQVDGQWVVSAAWQVGFNVGGLVASIGASYFYPYVAERYGRRGTLFIASLVSILAVFVEFFVVPHKDVMWFFGKFINGIAGSFFASTSSSYAIEVSPLQLRGVTTGLVNFYIAVGQFLSAVVIKGSGTMDTKAAFQIPIAIQWLFAVVILCGLPFCPESPWVLVRQGKIDKARHSLHRLYSNTDEDIDFHLTVIKETLDFEAKLHASSSWSDMFKGTDRRRTLIIMLIYICQQVTGVQFVLGYSTYFFELAGIPDSQAFALNVGTLSLALVSNLAGLFLMNTMGRRNVFLTSVYACTVDCLLIGICSLIKNNQSAIWAMASFTMLYMLTFQFGLGPLTYTYTAEIGSARLRSRVIAWGNICNQFFSLIIQIINPYMINPDEANLQGKVGWLFGGMSIFAAIAAWYWVPETGGRTTDELDLMFKKKVPALKFGKYEISHEDRLEMEEAARGA